MRANLANSEPSLGPLVGLGEPEFAHAHQFGRAVAGQRALHTLLTVHPGQLMRMHVCQWQPQEEDGNYFFEHVYTREVDAMM